MHADSIVSSANLRGGGLSGREGVRREGMVGGGRRDDAFGWLCEWSWGGEGRVRVGGGSGVRVGGELGVMARGMGRWVRCLDVSFLGIGVRRAGGGS